MEKAEMYEDGIICDWPCGRASSLPPPFLPIHIKIKPNRWTGSNAFTLLQYLEFQQSIYILLLDTPYWDWRWILNGSDLSRLGVAPSAFDFLLFTPTGNFLESPAATSFSSQRPPLHFHYKDFVDLIIMVSQLTLSPLFMLVSSGRLVCVGCSHCFCTQSTSRWAQIDPSALTLR